MFAERQRQYEDRAGEGPAARLIAGQVHEQYCDEHAAGDQPSNEVIGVAASLEGRRQHQGG